AQTAEDGLAEAVEAGLGGVAGGGPAAGGPGAPGPPPAGRGARGVTALWERLGRAFAAGGGARAGGGGRGGGRGGGGGGGGGGHGGTGGGVRDGRCHARLWARRDGAVPRGGPAVAGTDRGGADVSEPEVAEAPDTARRRHAELSVEIAENDYRYYILDSPL